MAVIWSESREAAPVVADFGQQRLQGRIAYLATIRNDGSPRVHPVSPVITQDGLFVYMEPTSPKVHDLRRDPRYAIHAAVEDHAGGQGEFYVKGDAVEIPDASVRNQVFEHAKAIGRHPLDRYILFELRVAESMATSYEDDQPKKQKWKSG
jgi:hypothetical protein